MPTNQTIFQDWNRKTGQRTFVRTWDMIHSEEKEKLLIAHVLHWPILLSYKVKAQITIELEIGLEAASATEAQCAVTWMLANIDFSESENEIEVALEHNVPMRGAGTHQ